MKKKVNLLRKICLFMLALILVLPNRGYAKSGNLNLVNKSEAFERWENLSQEERKNTIQPSFQDISIKDSIKKSEYNTLLKVGSTDDDGYYNLKDHISNIAVKNQQRTGLCWAFSFSSVLDTTFSTKYNTTAEFSPTHIDYVTSSLYNKKLGDGANANMAIAYSVTGYGPVYENDFKFEDYYNEEQNSSTTSFLTDPSMVDLNKIVRARVEGATFFADIYKSYSSSAVTYRDSNAIMGATTYTKEEVQAIRNLIKEHIRENGAITALQYSDMGVTAEGDHYSSRGYYNNDTKAFYCDNSYVTPNHAVTIVGWDDNYSKENFAEGHKPLNDGAYIVLNSWGTEFGDNGYFYVSYDDSCIEQGMVGINTIKKYDETNTSYYDNLYQHDELGYSIALYIPNAQQTAYLTSIQAANVYTRENPEEQEYVSEIGIYLYSTQGVEIYLNPEDGDLTKTTLVASYTGANALEAGYHTLKLASPIKLTGDEFVVGIKYINSTGAQIPIECDLLECGFSSTSNMFDTVVSAAGESYISLDGETWSDMYNYTLLDVTFKNTNACIKAFTIIDENISTEVEAQSIELNKTEATIEEGETVTLVATVLPENATNKNVVWTTSNSDIATVSGGVVTGKSAGVATITVETEDGKISNSCTVTVEEKQPEVIEVSSIELNKTEAKIKEGETVTLVATVLPENATNKNVIWITSDSDIATVNGGIVTGKSEGVATITVKTEDGRVSNSCTVTVEERTNEVVEVTGISLNKDTANIKEGETVTLVATVLPENATNKNVVWTTSNSDVATVSNGIVEGKTAGTVTITAKTEEGEFTDTCIVTVEEVAEVIEATEINLNKYTATIKEGETVTLVATVLPENATNKNVVWSTSNSDVASVDGGVVTGKSAGIATIIAETEDGRISNSCTVTVEGTTNIDVKGVSLDRKSLTMQVGDRTNLVATIEPLNATNKNVIWASENENIATINENGIITAVSAGNTRIIVITEDCEYTASCNLTVVEKTNTDDDIYTEDGDKNEDIPQKDDTISKEELPNTGSKIIKLVLLSAIGITIILYKKNKQYKGIK